MSDEKVYDGLEALSEISGVPRAEVKAIWEDVKANQARLNTCARPHDFRQDEPGTLRSKWTCALCGGKVTSREARWYILGLEDAGQ
jgi:hypothetical protein